MTTGTQNKNVNTWKPVTAGILSIIAGVVAFLIGLRVFRIHEFIGRAARWELWGVMAIILGAVAITGGIFALRRRIWGMALAGAICALFPPHVAVLGILAIIFVALSKGEFDQPAAKETIILAEKPETKAGDNKTGK